MAYIPLSEKQNTKTTTQDINYNSLSSKQGQSYVPLSQKTATEQVEVIKGFQSLSQKIDAERDIILQKVAEDKEKERLRQENQRVQETISNKPAALFNTNFVEEQKRIEKLPLLEQTAEYQRLSNIAKREQTHLKNVFGPTQTFLETVLPSAVVLAISGKERFIPEKDLDMNPWVKMGMQTISQIYNIALLSQVAGAIGVPKMAAGIWKALPLTLKTSKWGSYGARILSEIPGSATIFGALGGMQEALSEITDRKFSPIDITKEAAKSSLFGIVATPAITLPSAPLRIGGNAFVMGGWTAAEKLIRNGNLIKEDLPEIVANATLGAAFSAIHAQSTTRIFEADRLASFNRYMLEERLGTRAGLNQKDKVAVADLLAKVNTVRILNPNNPIAKSLDNKLRAKLLFKKDVDYVVTKDGKAISSVESTEKTFNDLLTPEEKVLLEQIKITPGRVPDTIEPLPTPGYIAKAPQTVLNNFLEAESAVAKLDRIAPSIKIEPISKTVKINVPVITIEKETTEEKFKTAIKWYQESGITHEGDVQPLNAGLRDLIELYTLPEIQQRTISSVNKAILDKEITLDKDGKIILYRVGSVKGDNQLVSASYNKDFILGFQERRGLVTKDNALAEVKVLPQDVKIFIGGTEAEVLVFRNVFDKTAAIPAKKVAIKKEIDVNKIKLSESELVALHLGEVVYKKNKGIIINSKGDIYSVDVAGIPSEQPIGHIDLENELKNDMVEVDKIESTEKIVEDTIPEKERSLKEELILREELKEAGEKPTARSLAEVRDKKPTQEYVIFYTPRGKSTLKKEVFRDEEKAQARMSVLEEQYDQFEGRPGIQSPLLVTQTPTSYKTMEEQVKSGDDVDNLINKNFQEAKGQIKEEEQKGFVNLSGFSSETEVEIKDPDIKKVFNAGIKGSGILQNIKDAFNNFTEELKRLFIFEHKLKEAGYTQLVDNVRTGLIPIPRRAYEKGMLAYAGIFGLLDKQEERQTFIILGLEDFVERGGKGLENPGGVTVEQAQKELDFQMTQVNDKVKTAVTKTHALLLSIAKNLVARGVTDPDILLYENYFPHLVLDYMPSWWEGVASYLPRRLRTPYRPYTKAAVGSIKDIALDNRVLIHHFSAVFTDNMVDDWAIDEISKWDKISSLDKEQRAEIFGVNDKGNLNSPLPNRLYVINDENYKGFQYTPGRVLYGAQVFNPDLTEEAISNNWSLGEFIQQTRPSAVMGKYFKVYLLPETIAERFTRLKAPAGDIPILYRIVNFTTWWKRLTLDLAGLPFQIGNIFGDFFNTYLTAPGSLLRIKDSLDVLRLDRNEMNPQQKEWFDDITKKDVWGSSFVSEYRRLVKTSKNPLVYIEEVSTLRENILRGAMHIYQIERKKMGLDFVAPQFKAAIQGLDDNSAAAYIARNFTVDYSAISDGYRRFLRGLATPFITFYDYNVRNWAKYILVAPLLFAIKILAPTIAGWIYNNTGWRKQVEENIPAYFRWRPHIILNKTSDNKALIWSLQTPLDMAAGWIGADRIADKVTLVRANRMTIEEAAKQQLIDMGLAGPRELQQLMNPMIQFMQGAVSGKDPYTQKTIVPQLVKGTPEEKKLWAGYLLEKIALPLAQYSRTMQGTDPEIKTGLEFIDPIANWLVYGPLNFRRALGFYTVDLNRELASFLIDKGEQIKADRNYLLFKIEKAYIGGKSNNIIEDVQNEAKEKGFELSNEEINTRLASTRVQQEKGRALLRATTDEEKRKKLEELMGQLDRQRTTEILQALPKSLREEYMKRISPAME